MFFLFQFQKESRNDGDPANINFEINKTSESSNRKLRNVWHQSSQPRRRFVCCKSTNVIGMKQHLKPKTY